MYIAVILCHTDPSHVNLVILLISNWRSSRQESTGLVYTDIFYVLYFGKESNLPHLHKLT
jgi:hypothetical protein